MMKLEINKLKLIINDVSTVVDEKNRRVIHTVKWQMNLPYVIDWYTSDVGYKPMNGVAKGIAVCDAEDTFNLETGKKIARAIAESNAYYNACRRLNNRMNYLYKIIYQMNDMVLDFEDKTTSIIEHNKEYQSNLLK